MTHHYLHVSYTTGRNGGAFCENFYIGGDMHSNERLLVCRTFYAQKQNASRVFAIVWASVRPSVSPSVRPSVTLVICIKTVQASITKSSLWAAPRCLVYRDKISCHWVQGFSSNDGVKEGYLP